MVAHDVASCTHPCGGLSGDCLVSTDTGWPGGDGGRTDSLGKHRAECGDMGGGAGQSNGTWVVDSGAELNISGAFMYQYANVLERNPPVSVRGVDDELTQVNALVRTVGRLQDGEYLIRETLVCDSFQLALWSTEYMSGFGFAAVLEVQGKDSYV